MAKKGKNGRRRGEKKRDPRGNGSGRKARPKAEKVE